MTIVCVKAGPGSTAPYIHYHFEGPEWIHTEGVAHRAEDVCGCTGRVSNLNHTQFNDFMGRIAPKFKFMYAGLDLGEVLLRMISETIP